MSLRAKIRWRIQCGRSERCQRSSFAPHHQPNHDACGYPTHSKRRKFTSIKWWYRSIITWPIVLALVMNTSKKTIIVYVIAVFPRLAVYNDVEGWQNYQFWGNGVPSTGNYEVNITVPADHVMEATGTLQNPKEVCREQSTNATKKPSTLLTNPLWL